MIDPAFTWAVTSFVICVIDPGDSNLPSTVGVSPETDTGISFVGWLVFNLALLAPWILYTLYFQSLIILR
jgi:hypothetical protein